MLGLEGKGSLQVRVPSPLHRPSVSGEVWEVWGAYHERERLCPEGVRMVEIAHVHCACAALAPPPAYHVGSRDLVYARATSQVS